MPDSRSLALILCGAFFLSCGDDHRPTPSEPAGALRPAGACKVAAIDALIPQIYASKKHQSEASGFCGEVARLQDKGQYVDAVTTAYAWLTRTFDLYRADELVDGAEAEEAIEQLFDVEVFGTLLAPSFAALPDDPPDLSGLARGLDLDPDLNGVIVKQFAEACDGFAGEDDPCIATTPNRHAALQLKQNGVHVVITVLPPQGDFGFCTAEEGLNDLSHDCFDFQLQVAVFPEGAVLEPGTIGLCVNDRSEFAPSSDVVLGVTKGEKDENGALAFLPAANAPVTLDCTDVEIARSGFGGALWSALGPAWRLLSPRSAIADPGKLGASMGAFSPVVAADKDFRRGSISGTAQSVFDEVSGADVTVWVPDSVVATTKTDAAGTFTVDSLPILGEDGTTYTVTVVRNGTLQDVESATLKPFPLEARDVVGLVFDLVPPGQQ